MSICNLVKVLYTVILKKKRTKHIMESWGGGRGRGVQNKFLMFKPTNS